MLAKLSVPQHRGKREVHLYWRRWRLEGAGRWTLLYLSSLSCNMGGVCLCQWGQVPENALLLETMSPRLPSGCREATRECGRATCSVITRSLTANHIAKIHSLNLDGTLLKFGFIFYGFISAENARAQRNVASKLVSGQAKIQTGSVLPQCPWPFTLPSTDFKVGCQPTKHWWETEMGKPIPWCYVQPIPRFLCFGRRNTRGKWNKHLPNFSQLLRQAIKSSKTTLKEWKGSLFLLKEKAHNEFKHGQKSWTDTS